MIQRIYTIYDEKAKAYLLPFFQANEELAIRNLSDCLKNQDHAFTKNPADYTLYYLGIFDDTTAEIEVAHELITTLLELKARIET